MRIPRGLPVGKLICSVLAVAEVTSEFAPEKQRFVAIDMDGGYCQTPFLTTPERPDEGIPICWYNAGFSLADVSVLQNLIWRTVIAIKKN